MIGRKKFYDTVRLRFGNLVQGQVDGFNSILDRWEEKGLTDLRHLAYMLATSWHETAHTMQAIEEYGHGRGHTYGVPDPKTGKAYFGRGHVQLTWAENYKKMGALLGVDLYNKPELALDPVISVDILFEGMMKGLSGRGDFTGVALENYFNDQTNDPYNARRIVNGMDRAGLIAGHHYNFLEALS